MILNIVLNEFIFRFGKEVNCDFEYVFWIGLDFDLGNYGKYLIIY